MATIISERHNINSINFVAGLSDPGEMIRCGYLPEIRRQEGEQDQEYADRIRPIVMALPKHEQDKILKAAILRAGLDTSNGRVAVMVAGTPAWHGLGVNIESAATSEEAIRLAGLDWTVLQWPLSAWNPDPMSDEPPMPVSIRKANVRSDTKTILGVVGNNYEPLQNAEAFAFMDGLVGEKLAIWETAGSIHGGRKVWMLARLPKTIRTTGEDETLPYALISNSHDGTHAVHVMPTTDRVVCRNTLRIALSKGEERKLVIKHSGSLKNRVAEAKKCLGIVSFRLEEYEVQTQLLAGKSLKESEIRDYFEQFYPTKVKPQPNVDGASLLDSLVSGEHIHQQVVSDMLSAHYAETERIAKRNATILEQLLSNQQGELVPGTAWSAYNAVSEHIDHQVKYRSADSRLNSAWFAQGNEVKQQAFQAALALTK